jgi:hypothetical protein
MTAGRPTGFKPEYIEQATKLCRLGATDKDLADFFEVCESTIDNWKNAHPEFLGSIKEAKAEADSRVIRALFERATGYSHPEDKIFNHNGEALVVPTTKHYPPDPTSAIFWLKNRQPDDWRDKYERNHSLSPETIALLARIDGMSDEQLEDLAERL